MTQAEFMPLLKHINSLWGVEFDDYKAAAWHRVLGSLNLGRLFDSLNELALDAKFSPKIAEIVEKYSEIKMRQARNARRAQQNIAPANTLHHCYICRNQGIVFYTIDRYEYLLRCSCSRGKDLSRWSRYQITKNMPWHNTATKEDENLYISAVDDVLTAEEIGLIQAKNMSHDSVITDRADINSAMQLVLGRTG